MTIDGSQAGQTARGGPAIRISSTTRDMLDGIKAMSPESTYNEIIWVSLAAFLYTVVHRPGATSPMGPVTP
jgi:hypothetical protein